MRYAILALLFLLPVNIYCSEASSKTKTASEPCGILLYPYFDYFSGIQVRVTGDSKVYSTENSEIKKMLTGNVKSKELLEGYYSKNIWGNVITYASFALLLIDLRYVQVYSETHMNVEPDTTALTTAVFMLGVGTVGIFVGPWLLNEGYNDFYKSLNEYNLTITCGDEAKAVIKKDIKF